MTRLPPSGPPAAAALRGRRWLNSDADLRLEDLRGRVVLLAFWCADCADCARAWHQLRSLRATFGAAVQTVAVHSPRFAHQAEPQALDRAVERNGFDAPVLDDADLETWDAYGISAWPTLVVIDPLGAEVARLGGDLPREALAALVGDLVATERERGALTPGRDPYRPREPAGTPLRFPSGALPVPEDRPLAPAFVTDGRRPRFLVADTAGARLVLLDEDLSALAVIGPGQGNGTAGDTGDGRTAGTGDATPDGYGAALPGAPGNGRVTAPGPAFREPRGMTLLPAAVAAAVGYDVVVADAADHTLRGVSLRDGTIVTVAGTGALRQGSGGPRAGSAALEEALAVPADVAWFDGFVAVAMAAADQLWAFVPAVDPAAATLAVLAGTGNAGLVDGSARRAWFAQPSGLAVAADGGTLWISDAQSSALRWLRRSLAGGYEVGTGVGHGLFESGFRDGRRDQALLQHPGGIAALPDGTVAIADTYNGAVRRFDPVQGEVTTIAGALDEPTAVVPLGDDVLVTESGAHRVVRIPLGPGVRQPADVPAPPRPPTPVGPGRATVEVRFTPPPGERLDDRSGPATWLAVSAVPPDILSAGGGNGVGLRRDLVFPDPRDGGPDRGVLHVAVHAATVPEDGEPDGAARSYRQDWAVPVTLADHDGTPRITLDLLNRIPPG